MTLTVEAWCEALESGKYEQTSGQLRNDYGYCCLGVACDLSRSGDWADDYYCTEREEPALTDLPYSVRDALGLSDDAGWFDFSSLPLSIQRELHKLDITSGRTNTLIGLNDLGVPFPLIAKVIRARPKGLFREDV